MRRLTSTMQLLKADIKHIKALQQAFAESEDLLHPWVSEPADYRAYVKEPHRYLILNDAQQLLGTLCISGIIQGAFQSAYLGYNLFTPFNGQGNMHKALQLALTKVFTELNLHRLEANIQPDNLASIRLVEKLGFKREGYSEKYLFINGAWRDHVRYALVKENWLEN